MAKTTSKTTTTADVTATKATNRAQRTATTNAPESVKQTKLPTMSFPCGKLSILSLLTCPFDRAGTTYIGLDQLDPDEQTLFLKFLEYAGEPIQPLDLTRLLKVTVKTDEASGVLALSSISAFSTVRSGDMIVLTLGTNTWEVTQETTETGSVFRVGKLSSALNCNTPKENEPLSAWFNWRVRDPEAGQIFEWAQAPVYYLRVDKKAPPTMLEDLKAVMLDGEDLMPLLGLKIVNDEPVWKLAYPDGDDSQPPLDMPLEFCVVGVEIKTYTGGTGQPSRVVRLLDAPYEAVAVRGKAAETVDALVTRGLTTFEPGIYKLQVFSVEVEGEGASKKHYTKHQIVRGTAVVIPVDSEEEDETEYEVETSETEYEEEPETLGEDSEELEEEDLDEEKESEALDEDGEELETDEY